MVESGKLGMDSKTVVNVYIPCPTANRPSTPKPTKATTKDKTSGAVPARLTPRSVTGSELHLGGGFRG